MRRDVRTFTISDSTRVCSDFYDLTSLLKFIANPQCQPKLLPDALPETDRSTGYTIMLIDMANDVSTPSYYVVEGPLIGVDTELPEWCCCGNCTVCNLLEAICCNHRHDVESLLEYIGDCVIDNKFVKINVLSKEGIIFSRDLIASSFKDLTAKAQYLSAELNNAMKRNIVNTRTLWSA